MHSFPYFLLLISITPLVQGHGCITKVIANGQVACSVNAQDTKGCNPTNGLKLRTLIPRWQNTGECAKPPGCEAPWACDWCGLEKTLKYPKLENGNWWTELPAVHWDQIKPQYPCMSKQQFGDNGIMNLKPGDSITANFYINADHSGLYRYELMCGNAANNANFNPITPWLALHATKDGANLAADRIVGFTKDKTNEYFLKTTCTGAGCSYRMNAASKNPDEQHCKDNWDDCNVVDTFLIPKDSSCRGDAILRWVWNSAEGPETYANCLDLNMLAPPPSTATSSPSASSTSTSSPSASSPSSSTPPSSIPSIDSSGQNTNGVSFGIMSLICSMLLFV